MIALAISKVSVPPHCHSEMEKLLRKEGIEYTIAIRDLERLIREERYTHAPQSFLLISRKLLVSLYSKLFHCT